MCGNECYCSHFLPFQWNYSHSLPFPVQHLIPNPILSLHLYSHSLSGPIVFELVIVYFLAQLAELFI